MPIDLNLKSKLPNIGNIPISVGAPAMADAIEEEQENKSNLAGQLAALKIRTAPITLKARENLNKTALQRAAEVISGHSNMNPTDVAEEAAAAAAQAVTEIQNTSAVDSMDMEDITGKQHASMNLTQISVQQLDVYVEPHRILTQLTNAHVPAKLNMTPVVAVFDTEGTPFVNGTKLTDPDAPEGSDNTLPAFTLKHTPGQPCVGWLIVAKRSDVRFGRSYFSVNQDNVFVASYEVTDLASEGRFSLLPAITDNVALVNGQGADVVIEGGAADVVVPIGASARAMTAYVDYEGVDQAERKAPSLTISGHNIIMYVYQLPYTREINSLLAQAYVHGKMGDLAQILLNAV